MFARSARQLLVSRMRVGIVSGSRGQFVRRSASAFAAVTSLDESRWNLTAAAALALLTTATVTACQENTPSTVAKEDLEEVTAMHQTDTLPTYTAEFVAEHNGEDGTRIWMTYGGIVYDVTDFIPNHPGGSEQILKASGGVSFSS